jgi:RNA polymerase sigma-70 factor, ECF subfamily
MKPKTVTTSDSGVRVTKNAKLNPKRERRTGRRTSGARVLPAFESRPQAEVGDDYADLVRSAATGDAAALNRLLMRAQETAWRFSTSVCGDADDAEDAMQEALIKTYRYVGRIREPAAFRPWLYRTVRNACLMGRRKRKGEPAYVQSLDEAVPADGGTRQPDVPHPGKNPEQIADTTRLRRRLRKALHALPGPYRAIVFLREVEGLSTREVAAVMGISEDNVKARLHRARVQLQAHLGSAVK